jgi:peptidoglycan/xylan/chitin deacetylase (PgdA/CDA1 family)
VDAERPVEIVTLSLHGIGPPRRRLTGDEERFWLTELQFEDILRFAAETDDVRLTFDDGNVSDIDIALPALLRRGLTAAFFPVAGNLGRPGYVREEDLKALVDASMIVGSHGMRHRPWKRTLSQAELHEELTEARDVIADATGGPVTMVACPYGWYDRGTIAHLQALRYQRVFTSDGGPGRVDSWLQPRNTVLGGQTAADLRRALESRRGLVSRAGRFAKRTVKRWR